VVCASFSASIGSPRIPQKVPIRHIANLNTWRTHGAYAYQAMNGDWTVLVEHCSGKSGFQGIEVYWILHSTSRWLEADL